MDDIAQGQDTPCDTIPTWGSMQRWWCHTTILQRLQNSHQTWTLNSTPHLSAARASIPVRRHQAPKITILFQAVLSFIYIPGSLHKKEFHSRELLQVYQHQCLLPTTKTHFLGANQVRVFQHNCNRYLKKMSYPRSKNGLEQKLPYKTKGAWLAVGACGSKGLWVQTFVHRELPNSCRQAVTGYPGHKNPRTTEFLSLQIYRGISILNPLITLRN